MRREEGRGAGYPAAGGAVRQGRLDLAADGHADALAAHLGIQLRGAGRRGRSGWRPPSFSGHPQENLRSRNLIRPPVETELAAALKAYKAG